MGTSVSPCPHAALPDFSAFSAARLFSSSVSRRIFAAVQGLTLAHFKAQLEDLRDTSLTLELNLSTFGPHPRVKLAYMGDEVHLS